MDTNRSDDTVILEGDDAALDMVLLGLAKDCAETLPRFFELLDGLNAIGHRTHAIIGENGSRDSSRALLKNYCAHGPLTLVDTSNLATIRGRLERMAVGREMLLDEVKAWRRAPRFVGVVDLDEPMARPPAPNAVVTACRKLAEDDGVFARSATSTPTYYDLLAFESEDLSFANVDFHAHHLRRSPLKYYRFYTDFVYPHQADLVRSQEIWCISAFNGFCIYRSGEYLKASYCEDSLFDVSEHVTLHRKLQELTGRPMLVDPTLVVNMPAEHGHRGFFAFWLQRLSKLMRIVRPQLARPAFR